MKAIVLKRPGDFSIEEIPTPEPQADEVLIRIHAAGICTNDVRDFRGDCSYSYPRIGGHEYCGTIERLGSAVNAERFSVGQKVVQYITDRTGARGLTAGTGQLPRRRGCGDVLRLGQQSLYAAHRRLALLSAQPCDEDRLHSARQVSRDADV